MFRESMISLCIINFIIVIVLKICNKKVIGKLLYTYMFCLVCILLKFVIYRLLRKVVVSSVNLIFCFLL